MVSAFQGPSIGFGTNLPFSKSNLSALNCLRENKDYINTTSALEVNNCAKKACFSNVEKVRDVMCKQFNYGKDISVYWKAMDLERRSVMR